MSSSIYVPIFLTFLFSLSEKHNVCLDLNYNAKEILYLYENNYFVCIFHEENVCIYMWICLESWTTMPKHATIFLSYLWKCIPDKVYLDLNSYDAKSNGYILLSIIPEDNSEGNKKFRKNLERMKRKPWKYLWQ